MAGSAASAWSGTAWPHRTKTAHDEQREADAGQTCADVAPVEQAQRQPKLRCLVRDREPGDDRHLPPAASQGGEPEQPESEKRDGVAHHPVAIRPAREVSGNPREFAEPRRAAQCQKRQHGTGGNQQCQAQPPSRRRAASRRGSGKVGPFHLVGAAGKGAVSSPKVAPAFARRRHVSNVSMSAGVLSVRIRAMRGNRRA